jgi:thioester reductase-like protein
VSHYFLSGGTGVVGSAIANQLLEKPANRITLLIRAESDAHLASRLSELFRFWEREPGATRERLTALRGDTSLPQFGLPPDVFEQLCQQCTHIIHCAALVRMNLPLEDARRSSVGAAENVVRLAECARAHGVLQKVEFLSTVGVGGRRSGRLPERILHETRTFHNTYEHAKAEAETYVAERIAEGLPVTLHRPSMVVGDSVTGRVMRFQIFYHLVEFLTGTRTLGMFPRFGHTRLDLVPVDYVAAAVVWSSGQAATAGRVLHLCSGPEGSIPIGELQAAVRAACRAAGRTLPPVIALPIAAFRGAVRVIGTLSPPGLTRAIATLPIFLDYLAEDQSFENQATRRLLGDHGIVLPPVESYLRNVLAYYFTVGQEDPVRR